jgi:DASS family divalent anion:Na+ symporter
VPSLIAICSPPLIVATLSARVGEHQARGGAQGPGQHGRDVARWWITAGTFVLMVAGWVFGNKLHLNTTSVNQARRAAVLNVITLDDITKRGRHAGDFLWLAVLFAMSAQLNELGFMGYVGSACLGPGRPGLADPVRDLIVLYVLIHYMFVSQTSQVLALFSVFLDVVRRAACRCR